MTQNLYTQRHKVGVGDIGKNLSVDGVLMERLFVLS